MKYIIGLCCCWLLLGATAQTTQTTTIILLRQAEKDTSHQRSMMTADPLLTKAGEARAIQLLTVLKAYQPDEIYSTNYKRTKATVAPLAEKFHKDILIYDPSKLPAFAQELLSQGGKTIVVAGHSNTTPALVNLLIKESKYHDLPDSVYNRFWIVTIKDGVASEQVVEY